MGIEVCLGIFARASTYCVVLTPLPFPLAVVVGGGGARVAISGWPLPAD